MGGKRKREHDDVSELEYLKKRSKKIMEKIAKLGGKVQAGNMADANDPNKIKVVVDVHAPNDKENTEAVSEIDHEEIVGGSGDESEGSEVAGQDKENSSPNITNKTKESSEDNNSDSDSDSVFSKNSDKVVLEKGMLDLLGYVSDLEEKEPVHLNSELMNRWLHWKKNGLKSEERDKVLKEYPLKGKQSLEAPVLNLEIKNILTGTAKARDGHFVKNQETLGAALIAIGRTLTTVLEKPEEVNRDELVKQLSDAGKLISDLHCQLSTARRSFLIPVVDASYKTVLEESKVDTHLFGGKLATKMKEAKVLKKTGEELSSKKTGKTQKEKSQPSNKRGLSGNFQGHPQQANKSGGPQKPFMFKNYSDNKGYQYKGQNQFQKGSWKNNKPRN